jgi:hypothetical protein
MGQRIPGLLIAVAVAAGVLRADVAYAQKEPPSAWFNSLEWSVANGAMIVRGVAVDVSTTTQTDRDAMWTWNIVTLDVKETIKGDKVERVKFALTSNKSNTLLQEWTKAKKEVLWILRPRAKSQTEFGALIVIPPEVDWFAPTWGLPLGEWKLPVAEDGFMTLDLKIITTPDDLLKTIRKAVAEENSQKPFPSHDLELPKKFAKRHGLTGYRSYLTAPVDHRLEKLARRLVQSPGDFLAKDDVDERRELQWMGVKALRLFRSEENLALLKTWLEDPNTPRTVSGNAKFRIEDLLPPVPKTAASKPFLAMNLAEVPEVHFQQPLTKALETADAQLHTAVTIDRVHALNQKKTDAFMEALSKRPDLAGLSFAMGDSCRMKPDASQKFLAALKEPFLNDIIAKWNDALNETDPFKLKGEEKEKGKEILRECHRLLAELAEQDASFRVAAYMQTHGAETAEKRLNFVEFLDGLAHADATRALAKLAIFSEEPEIRAAAVKALKMRRESDYTDILLTGLRYPWPAVAERTSEAIVMLGRTDLIPKLVDVLKSPDPRAPQIRDENGKKVTVVRELVRINHHHNCLLCHAPDTSSRDQASKEETEKLAPLTAQVPVPSEAMNAYYSPNSPDILIRFDVTYLRQDFSMKLPVADAAPWPEMQRYDFVVRTREVTEQEADAYRELLVVKAASFDDAAVKAGSFDNGPLSPYHRAALTALRELTAR